MTGGLNPRELTPTDACECIPGEIGQGFSQGKSAPGPESPTSDAISAWCHVSDQAVWIDSNRSNGAMANQVSETVSQQNLAPLGLGWEPQTSSALKAHIVGDILLVQIPAHAISACGKGQVALKTSMAPISA